MQSISRRIFSSALTVGSLNGVVMIATIVRDLAFAHRFGTGEIIDGFLMGLLIPTIATQLVANSLALALLPEIVRLKGSPNTQEENHIASSGLLLGLSLLCVVGLILFGARQQLTAVLNAGFDVQRAQLSTFFYVGLLPCVLIQGWSILVGCMLNAAQYYAVVAISPMLRPLAVCAAIFGSNGSNDAQVILAAYLIGATIEAGWITIAAMRAGVMPRAPVWSLTSSLKRVIREFRMVILGSGILSIATLADQYFASLDVLGGVSSYGYGTKITNLIISVGALPLGVAILPHFTEQVHAHAWTRLRYLLIQWTAITLAMSIPIAALLWVFSAEITSFVFQRGAFSEDDTKRVASVQKFLALQIPFYLCGVLYIRALISLQRNWVVAMVGTCNASINIGGSLILLSTMGVSGVALSATLGYAIANVFAGLVVFQLIGKYMRMEKVYQA